MILGSCKENNFLRVINRMVDLKKLDALEKEVIALKEEISFLRRSHYRDLDDWKQFAKDLGNPVTGNYKPEGICKDVNKILCERDKRC